MRVLNQFKFKLIMKWAFWAKTLRKSLRFCSKLSFLEINLNLNWFASIEVQINLNLNWFDSKSEINLNLNWFNLNLNWMTPYSVLFSALRRPRALLCCAAQACRPVCCCCALRGGCFVSLRPRSLSCTTAGTRTRDLEVASLMRCSPVHSFWYLI